MGFFRNFVTTAYVGAFMDSDKCEVHINIYKGKRFIKSETHSLTLEDGKITRTGIQLFKSFYQKYYFVYSGAMLLSTNQGAFDGVGDDAIDKHQIRYSGTTIVPIDAKWSIYASESDLSETKQNYENLGGLDYIFSAFSIIDIIKNSGFALYIIKLHGWAALAVYDESKFLYGNFFHFTPNESSFDEGLTLDDNQLAAADSDIENTQMEEISDIAQTENGEEEIVQDSSSLERDMKLVEFIKTSLNDFYKNPIYQSDFIEKAIVVDPYFDSEEFKILAEEELMLTIEIKEMKISNIICDLVQKEATK